MKYLAVGGVALAALSGTAQAGGLERADQSVGVLFEKGRHLEFSVGVAHPDVTGVGSNLTPTPGQESGNIAEAFHTLSFAYKSDINDSISYAIIYDEPYGADVAYSAGTAYFARASEAELESRALTGILQYNIANPGDALGGQFSIYAGARAQYLEASATLPFLGYTAEADGEIGFGYLLGGAWERPDLGMRVSVTYISKITTAHDTQEAGFGTSRSSVTDIETPEAINLEFQTGVTQSTLLFGSVRWVGWSDFEVAPSLYTGVTGGPLAFFLDDRITYRLGVGQRLTENLSVFGALGYEESTGSGTTNLTPVDGFMSYSLGTTYKYDRARVTFGVRYADLGDAGTILGGNQPAGVFSDNSLWAGGVKVALDLN